MSFSIDLVHQCAHIQDKTKYVKITLLLKLTSTFTDLMIMFMIKGIINAFKTSHLSEDQKIVVYTVVGRQNTRFNLKVTSHQTNYQVPSKMITDLADARGLLN